MEEFSNGEKRKPRPAWPDRKKQNKNINISLLHTSQPNSSATPHSRPLIKIQTQATVLIKARGPGLTVTSIDEIGLKISSSYYYYYHG
jgi:hypothetical protein